MQMLLQDVNIGKNIRKLRDGKNLSQAQLAEQMQLLGSNISRDTLAKIESGTRNLKISDLMILRRFFDVDYRVIIDGE